MGNGGGGVVAPPRFTAQRARGYYLSIDEEWVKGRPWRGRVGGMVVSASGTAGVMLRLT
jgi:hypothetical protein